MPKVEKPALSDEFSAPGETEEVDCETQRCMCEHCIVQSRACQPASSKTCCQGKLQSMPSRFWFSGKY